MEEKRKRREYSTKELQLLRDMREHGYTMQEIANILGRTKRSLEVATRYYAMPRKSFRSWPPYDTQKLIEMYNGGKGPKEIGEIMGKTPGSVQARLQRLRARGAQV